MAPIEIYKGVKRDMIALGVKYRPLKWDDIVGQDINIDILKKQVENESVKNSLFTGASGCGKTSVARLVGKYLDAEIIEIDAASNNGVDNIRAIKDFSYERSLSNKYKIIILDEAHMLTTQSWNALLKILEETPKYTIFILCTTDPQKIPQTIFNRVQRYNFLRISNDKIINKLYQICKNENLSYSEDAIDYIAKSSNGSMREALSLLGQIADISSDINTDITLKVLGISSHISMFNIIKYMIEDNEKDLLLNLNNQLNNGQDIKVFIDQFLDLILDISKYIIFNDLSITNIPSIHINVLKSLIGFNNPINYYNYLMGKLLEVRNNLKNDLNPKLSIEAYFLQMARCI